MNDGKMHPKSLAIKDFDYNLPDEKIARYPLAKRDESKLLVWKKGFINEDCYHNIDQYLPAGSLIIFNNTRVIEARILFQKKTGTTIEIFCLEPSGNFADITTAMSQAKNVLWKCLIGNSKKWKDELLQKIIYANGAEIILTAKKISSQKDDFIIEFSWNADISFAELLHFAGVIPLPPYLNRHAEKDDAVRYQTVYARKDGSVAAPTAGLHFTNEILEKLSVKNIKENFITLHVGAGTFKPVKTDTIEMHEMHAEYFEVSKEFIEQLSRNLQNTVTVVGTTSLRTIESLYWMGVKIIHHSGIKKQREISMDDISVQQWDAYEINAGNISALQSLQALLKWMSENQLTKLSSKTQVIIAPPYQLKIANALITNFHQPKSTLLLLVAAVAGNRWKEIYEYALQHNFRFLSYGDGCLVFSS